MKSNNYMNKLKNIERVENVASPEVVAEKKAVVAEPVNVQKPSNGVTSDTSIIGIDTEIVGTVSSNGNLKILGAIKGDVSAKGNILVQGSIEGNLTANSIVSKGGKVQAETIKVETDFQVGENSEIIGNISSETITVDAKINGNISTGKTCSINKHAVIVGDIVAQNLSIELGASVSGHVESKG
ncbi:MAG: polymer-forming cytoskeletal protein [Eubacteriales bacterium]